MINKDVVTKKQLKELDKLKSTIEGLEARIAKNLDLRVVAIELENNKQISSIDKATSYAYKQIKKSVSIQAESMGVDYDLVIDLMFNREYTILRLEKQSKIDLITEIANEWIDDVRRLDVNTRFEVVQDNSFNSFIECGGWNGATPKSKTFTINFLK